LLLRHTEYFSGLALFQATQDGKAKVKASELFKQSPHLGLHLIGVVEDRAYREQATGDCGIETILNARDLLTDGVVGDENTRVLGVDKWLWCARMVEMETMDKLGRRNIEALVLGDNLGYILKERVAQFEHSEQPKHFNHPEHFEHLEHFEHPKKDTIRPVLPSLPDTGKNRHDRIWSNRVWTAPQRSIKERICSLLMTIGGGEGLRYADVYH
jgi:hypothetical protein